jgi:hypothetical protein
MDTVQIDSIRIFFQRVARYISLFFRFPLIKMFEWLWIGHQPDTQVYASMEPTLDPKDLPFSASRVMLNKETDPPFMNDYWNYPLRGPSMPPLLYSDKIHHVPLFSSKDQMVDSTSKCAGKLHFIRSLHPEELYVNKLDRSVLTIPRNGYVITSSGADNLGKEAVISTKAPLKVNYTIGGSGPGGPEMSSKGPLSSHNYQKNGPHYIGKILKNGTMCIEPNSMEVHDLSIHHINDDIGNPPDSIIRTS